MLGDFFRDFIKKFFVYLEKGYLHKENEKVISVLLYRIPFIARLVCTVIYKDYILYLFNSSNSSLRYFLFPFPNNRITGAK